MWLFVLSLFSGLLYVCSSVIGDEYDLVTDVHVSLNIYIMYCMQFILK